MIRTTVLSTWLFKIATNEALTWLKRASLEVAMDDELIATIVSTRPGPDVIAHHAKLRNAVARLQARHRAVISLHYWQGLSYQEVASVLGVPIGSVRSWLSRAKKQLRKELS